MGGSENNGMKPFDGNEFDALRETGVTGNYLLGRIHEYYETTASAAISTAEHRGVFRGYREANLIGTVLTVVGLAVLLVGVVLGCVKWKQADDAVFARFNAACENGDTVRCLEAVQDASQQGQRGTVPIWATDDIARYKLAYKLKTGQDLPN